MSDVYVYSDCYGGFTTHVAGNRYAIQPLPSLPITWASVFGGTFDKETRKVVYPSKLKARVASVFFWIYARWEAVRRITLDRTPRRRIDLPHAGKRFNDATPAECVARLLELKAIGYHVPAYAITSLQAEANETPHA